MIASVEVRNLQVSYGTVTALSDVDLTVGPGRVCALIGVNGSGKSSLLKAIVGVVKVRSGDIAIGGQTPSAARRQGVLSYVPQHEDVDWAFPLSVYDVVMTGRYGHLGPTRRMRALDHQAVRDALARVNLTDLASRQIGALSGGQRKRAFVARGIAQGASVLLLDEPFAGVDVVSQETISQLLRELADDGAAVMIATHDLASLPKLADEAILLQRTILFHGTPEQALRPERLALAFGIDPLAEAGVR